MKLRDYRYRLLSHILWGNKKQHYKRKWKEAKLRTGRKMYDKLSKTFSQLQNTVPLQSVCDLSELISALNTFDYKGVYIIGTCDLGWFDTFKQRHHHIAEYLMKQNYLVICAMNPAHPLDNVSTYRFCSKNLMLVDFYNKNIWKQIIDLVAMHCKNHVFYSLIGTDSHTSINDCKYLNSLGISLIYDYCDEISKEICYNVSDMCIARHEFLLKDENVLIIATSDNLYQKACKYRKKNVIKSLNGVSLEDWDNADAYTPTQMEPIIALKHKIIGFYGSFAPWIDFDLIKHLALKRPDYEIVMIGYDYEWGKGSFAKSKISKIKNVHIIESQPYNKLKYFSRFFDVAMLPFKLTEVTKSVSPVKLFEFMAQGIPVVSTDMQECRKYPVLFIAKDKEEFVKNIDEAVEKKRDKKYLAELKSEAKRNTWEERGKQTLQAMEKLHISYHQPLLTIGIPCYNMENYILSGLKKLCIPSLINDIEILVINDGSTDRSSELVSNYNSLYENKIRLIQKENGGHGSCINRAIKEAKGKFFKLVDADDYCNPIALIKHIQFLKTCNSDAVVTNYNHFYDDGHTDLVTYEDRLQEKEYYVQEFIDNILIDTGFISYAHMHSLTYRTEIIKNIKITEHSFYVDNEYISYPFNILHSISYQNIALYQYYLGRPGQSVNPEVAKKRAYQNLNIIHNIQNFMQNEVIDTNIKKYLLNILYHESIFYIKYTPSKEEKNKLLQWWKDTSVVYYKKLQKS